MKTIEFIQGTPMVDPEKRKEQNTGLIFPDYRRGVLRYCAMFHDANGRVQTRICATLEYARQIMYDAGYNEL